MKNVPAVLLALTISLSVLLAGCGRDASPDVTDESSKSSSESAENSSEVEETSSVSEKICSEAESIEPELPDGEPLEEFLAAEKYTDHILETQSYAPLVMEDGTKFFIGNNTLTGAVSDDSSFYRWSPETKRKELIAEGDFLSFRCNGEFLYLLDSDYSLWQLKITAEEPAFLFRLPEAVSADWRLNGNQMLFSAAGHISSLYLPTLEYYEVGPSPVTDVTLWPCEIEGLYFITNSSYMMIFPEASEISQYSEVYVYCGTEGQLYQVSGLESTLFAEGPLTDEAFQAAFPLENGVFVPDENYTPVDSF